MPPQGPVKLPALPVQLLLEGFSMPDMHLGLVPKGALLGVGPADSAQQPIGLVPSSGDCPAGEWP